MYERAEAQVNAVNCVGVMGRGLALQFKKTWPDNFKAYAYACRYGLVRPGQMFIFQTGLTFPKFVVNFPTKRHWRDCSRIEDIESGLQALVEDVRELEIRSIAIPALGCGLGGLDFPKVSQLIEASMSHLPEVDVVVFLP